MRYIMKSLSCCVVILCLGVLLAGCPQNTPSAGTVKTISLSGDVRLNLVWCPAGTFLIGSPESELDRDSNETQHQVTLTEGFWIGQCEVTKGQWYAIMGTKPWESQDNSLDDIDSPACNISWNDAQLFVTTLSAVLGGEFALPTEAEWEYACRAGTTTRFYWGDDLEYTEIGNYAWYYTNTDGASEAYAHVVAQKTPNLWGVYDMIGNVAEWCSDWYKADLGDGDEIDPDGPESGTDKIQRGGSWSSYSNNCRSANRTHKDPELSNVRYGVRIIQKP